jgi:uncharacterized membrane protein
LAESATAALPTQTRKSQQRIWEIDALRGVAIIMMIIFHLMWDLWAYRILPDVILYDGFWKYFQRTTATLFITLVGVSLTVSYRRARAQDPDERRLFLKFLRRGLFIFALGMGITLFYRITNMGFVDMSVLHLIGFSIAAAYPFLRYRWLNLGLWALFNVVGYYLHTARWDFRWLAWLGFIPHAYYPNDYFPIIPWFGVALLGVFIGNMLYDDNGRRFPLPDLSRWLPISALRWLGRHSLIIYLTHQPILFGILMALGLIRLG